MSGFNISPDISNRAQKLGLEFISTGGGFDFVTAVSSQIGGTDMLQPRFILTDPFSGESPKAHKAKANVVVYLNDDWRSFVEFAFPSADVALDAMASPEFRMSSLWHLTQAMEAEDTDAFIKAFIQFSEKTRQMIEDHNLSLQQAAEAVLLWHEATLVAVQKTGEPCVSVG